MKRIIIIAFLLCCYILPAQINFLYQPKWADVLAQAKDEQKMIFVDAYTNWCSWCKVMDKKTFSDSTVQRYMNQHFINVKLEMETGEGITLAMKYMVTSYPTYMIFNSEGKYCGRAVGYMKPAAFVEKITALQPSYSKMPLMGYSTSLDMPYPDFYKASFIKNKEGKRLFADSATVEKYLDAQGDIMDEVPFKVLQRFHHKTQKYDQWILDKHTILRGAFGQYEVDKLLNDILISRADLAAAKKNEAVLHNELYPFIEKYLPANATDQKEAITLYFYKKTNNYIKQLMLLDEWLSNNREGAADKANEICWQLYETTSDKKILMRAAQLMKRATDKEPLYMYLDTYAAVLYKAGDYKTAEAVAQQAIAEGRKAGEKIEETEALLNKIKAKL